MGVWGTAISSNDVYADVYGLFFELFNAGKDVRQITSQLTQHFADTVSDPVENHDFWFALAKAQWECKQLDAEVLERVSRIIESGDNIRVWKELDASTSDLKKRRAVLEKFLNQLRSERASPRKRKKKIIREPLFEKGECLTFRLSNGNYGGAVVLAGIKGTEYNYNLIATTRINQKYKPTTEHFVLAELLVANYANYSNYLSIKWYLPVRNKEVADCIERVGAIPVEFDYSLDFVKFGATSDFDITAISHADRQFAFEANGGSRPKQRFIKEFTKHSRWKPWS